MTTATWSPPPTFPNDDGWERYLDAPLVDAFSAAELRPGDGSPEAAVLHYCASRIRGDADWEQVLPAERDEALQRKLDRVGAWTLRSARLVARKGEPGHRYYVKLEFEVEVEARVKRATNDFTVRWREDRWVVERMPV